MRILKNVFQVSTLKALLVLLAAFGVQTDGAETLVAPLSQIGLFLWAGWETLRNDKKGKGDPE